MNAIENEIEIDEIGTDVPIEGHGRCRAIPSPGEAARRPVVEGTAVVLGDGREWPLAAYVPSFGPAWDRLFDSNCLTGKYQPEDIRLAASRLLLENFDLSPEAVATLIVGADLNDLVTAVENALFGPLKKPTTWSDWAIGSLYANGIDPATVPPSRLLTVLNILVECRRTVPAGQVVDASIAGRKRAAILRRIEVPPEGSPS